MKRLKDKKDGWNEVLTKDLLVHQIFSRCPEAWPSIFLVCKLWQEALVNKLPISLLKEIIPPTECRRNLSTLPCIIIPSHTKTGDKIVQGFRVAFVLQKTEKGHLEICCVPRCDTFTNHVHKTIPSWLPIVDVNQYEKQHPEFSVRDVLDEENFETLRIEVKKVHKELKRYIDHGQKISPSPSSLFSASYYRLTSGIRGNFFTIPQIFEEFQVIENQVCTNYKLAEVNAKKESLDKIFNSFLQNSINICIEKLIVAIVESNKQKPTIN